MKKVLLLFLLLVPPLLLLEARGNDSFLSSPNLSHNSSNSNPLLSSRIHCYPPPPPTAHNAQVVKCMACLEWVDGSSMPVLEMHGDHRLCVECLDRLLKSSVGSLRLPRCCKDFQLSPSRFFAFVDALDPNSSPMSAASSSSSSSSSSLPAAVSSVIVQSRLWPRSKSVQEESAPWHNISMVLQQLQAFQVLCSLQITKCPGCSAFYYRDGGCDHISCPQCGLNFCFVCGDRDVTRSVCDKNGTISIFGSSLSKMQLLKSLIDDGKEGSAALIFLRQRIRVLFPGVQRSMQDETALILFNRVIGAGKGAFWRYTMIRNFWDSLLIPCPEHPLQGKKEYLSSLQSVLAHVSSFILMIVLIIFKYLIIYSLTPIIQSLLFLDLFLLLIFVMITQKAVENHEILLGKILLENGGPSQMEILAIYRDCMVEFESLPSTHVLVDMDGNESRMSNDDDVTDPLLAEISAAIGQIADKRVPEIKALSVKDWKWEALRTRKFLVDTVLIALCQSILSFILFLVYVVLNFITVH